MKYIFVNSVQTFRQQDILYRLVGIEDGAEFNQRMKFGVSVKTVDKNTALRNLDIIYNLENIGGKIKPTNKTLLEYPYDKDGKRVGNNLVLVCKFISMGDKHTIFGYGAYNRNISSLMLISCDNMLDKRIKNKIVNASCRLEHWEPVIEIEHELPTIYIDYATFLHECEDNRYLEIIYNQYNIGFDVPTHSYYIKCGSKLNENMTNEPIPPTLFGGNVTLDISLLALNTLILEEETYKNNRDNPLFLNDAISTVNADMEVFREIRIKRSSLDKVIKKLNLLGDFKRNIIIVESE